MLSCKELTELVTDYLEHRLSLSQRIQFEMHVGMCRNCRAYLRQMKVTVSVLGQLPTEPMPAEVRDELAARLSGMLPSATSGSHAPGWPLIALGWLERKTSGSRALAISGAILLVLLLALLLQGFEWGAPCDGLNCVLREVAAGLTFALGLGALAWSAHARVAARSYAVVGMVGALPMYALLQLGFCPNANVATHVLSYHFGGLVLAACLSAAVARIPVAR